ncbi:hypothetical protein KVT40_009364 [Elsinoe batatas]|uniref:Uncharacterized protein n=1 Tax=Elsinoe batatas TaxID=2601811 RepID=A0A8K0KZ18_9PEZI|nr:hypothetical protein KVT40_009364 [Elsinoe batatas]
MWTRASLSWASIPPGPRVRCSSCSPCRSVGHSTAQACQRSLHCHLKRYLQDNTERALDRSDVPSLKESLCWTFIENQALFENASLDSLRSYFRERIKATHEREQPRAHGFVEAPRYIYFLKADQEVLQELKHTTNNPDLTKAYGLSHIKLIRADASTLTNDNGSVDEEDAYEAIDGCSDFDVGWMKIALKLTGPSFYESLYGSNEAWYAYYQRPPDELLSC